MRALTAASARRLMPSARRREVPDGAAPGLYLVIQPSGKKSWAYRYRRPLPDRPNATVKLTLGTFDAEAEVAAEPVLGGHLTLASARKLASDLARLRALGRDPAADHFAEKARTATAAKDRAEHTFAAAARDFIERHARKNTRRWHETARLLGLRPENLESIKGGLASRWASTAVGDITRRDVDTLLDEVREHGVPGLERRSTGVTESRARAMLAALSKMFAWLLRNNPWKYQVENNPCAGVHAEKSKDRDRVLSAAEIVTFWRAAANVGEPFAQALRLLLLTGARLNEVCGMTLSEITEDGAKWTLAGSRTKNGEPHIVPLSPQARDILTSVKHVAGEPGFIFTTTGRSPVSGWSKIKARLDAAMNIPPWRLHDLRRTAATGMAEIGIPPHIVEALLNHISGAKQGVAGTYNRAQYLPERAAALGKWAAYVEGLVAENVVPMRRGA